MLQRIQSVWLLLAAACAFLSLKFPFFSGNITDSKNFTLFKDLNGLFNIPLLMLTLSVGIIALVCIFLYKNRTQQFRLTLIAIVLEVLLMVLYYSYSNDFVNGTFALTAILQACVAFFLFLAAKGIRHDEKIVQDSNRLR